MSRSIVGKRKRRRIYRRQNGRCYFCGGILSDRSLHHIVSLSEGGTNDESNLALGHTECHRDYHRKERLREQQAR